MDMQVVDLFAGVGGFSCGAERAGAKVIMAVEKDPRIAACFRSNHAPGTPVFEETLGEQSPATMARRLRRLLRATSGHTHVHGSPPCQALSQVNRLRGDPQRGMRLVDWFLQVVSLVRPDSWSMEQVNHPAVRASLAERSVDFVVVNMAEYGVPQSRRRIIAGDAVTVNGLRHLKGTVAPRLPTDVFPQLDPHRYRLCSGVDNTSVHRNGKYVGLRPMRPGECSRSLLEPAHTVWSHPGKIFDTETGQNVRNFTIQEMAALQGFPPDFTFDARSKKRSRVMVANAVPPPVAECIVRIHRDE